MARDARNELFMMVDMDGYICLFSNARLDRDTIPEGLHCYDVRDEDGDGNFAQIQPFVMVNHWGTLISKEPIPLNEHGCYWPEEREVFFPSFLSLDTYRTIRNAELVGPHLDPAEVHRLGKTIDSIPDDLFRIRFRPLMSRTGAEQERLFHYALAHKEDFEVPVSEYLRMTQEEYQAWISGSMTLGDGSYHEMGTSPFQLSSAALMEGQHLLRNGGIDQNYSSTSFHDAASSVQHTMAPQLSQFLKQLPSDQECMLSMLYDAQKPNLVLYGAGGNIFAIVAEDEVMYKEDFAGLMKASGMKASEATWQRVWEQFSTDFSTSKADVSLRDQAKTAIEKVRVSLIRESAVEHMLPKSSLANKIRDAEDRSETLSKSDDNLAGRDAPPPER